MNKKSCILAVDDDPLTLVIIEETLKELYDVILAASGLQALEILNQGKIPDIILLDIDMPEMDGYSTFKQIREIKKFAKIPILFVTGFNDSENELHGLELGAQDYISKPFEKNTLLARVRLRLETSMQLHGFQKMYDSLFFNEAEFKKLTRVLSNVEQDITRLIIQGYDNWEIAERLHYSYGYVKNTVSRILDKMNVNNRRNLRNLFKMEKD